MRRETRSRFFDHTADIGLEIEAADLPSLFLEASRAVLGWLGRFSPSDAPAAPEATSFHGRDAADLLVDWLSEVLYRAQDLRQIPGPDPVLEFRGNRLEARVRWLAVDAASSCIDRELKAATYHRLSVTGSADEGFRATVIFDV
jgi:SHS2 domain-containing protein